MTELGRMLREDGREEGELKKIIIQIQKRLRVMLEELKQEYQYSELDALLVLKDILYHVWKERKSQKRKVK